MRAFATTIALVASSALASSSAPPEAASGSSVVATPAPAVDPPARASVVPTQALVEKLGQGDRMFLAGDYRSALFAYQDAVYLQPRYAPARVRLGRAYLALRYPAQAIEQAEAALAEDPDSAEARKLLDEARAARPRPSAPAAAQTAPAWTGPRVYRLTPEPDPHAAASIAEVSPTQTATSTPLPTTASSPTAPPSATASPPTATAGAEHYRAAIGFLKARDWVRADAALSDAILADPKLAVAYSARGSARFALGKYREAAEDYRNAMELDPRLATPVYGLAECFRALGDGRKAAEMYARYAASSAPDVRADLRAAAEKRAHELQ